MPDLRNHDFFRSDRWASGTLTLNKVEADETFSTVQTVTGQFHAVEHQEGTPPFIEFRLFDSTLIASLNLKSFDGGNWNGKQYEFDDKRKVAQEPPHIYLKGVIVG